MRVWIAFSFTAILGLAIIGKIFWIQINEAGQWAETGKRFEQQVRPIVPDRGQILSADGSLLATSVPVYSIYWDSKCDGLQDKMDEFDEKLDSLCFGLSDCFKDRTPAEYREIFETARRQGNRYTKVITKIDYTQMKAVKELPIVNWGRYKSGFVIDRVNVRQKPFGKLASRTIGLDREGERVGIERAYHHILAGKEGSQLQEKIAGNIWKPISDDFIVEPIAGSDVISTLDIHLQDIAETELEVQLKKNNASWGCVVLMEVKTGYVKAIANLERFEGEEGEEDEFYESYNYALGFRDEPGSTFKLPAMMAALESGKITPSDSIDMGDGSRKYYGQKITDSNHDKGGHGKGSVADVFRWSSNIGMAEISERCFRDNKQQYLDYLKALGVQDSLGISIKGEKKPLIYEEVGQGNWSGISHIWMSMGYEVAQSPIQTLAFYNAIANNGQLLRPLFASEFQRNGRTIEKVEPVVLRDNICSSRTLGQVKAMMESVCQEGGTADYIFKDSPYAVAGKTGTARLVENGAYQSNRYRGSFVGYFPADKPKYSCIVVLHDPRGGAYYGSSIAAPVFKRLADHLYNTQLFEKKAETEDEMIAETRIPVSKNGSREKLNTVFQNLGISTTGQSQSTWISTSTQSDHVQLNERDIQSGIVPDVRGMGLQDALFLLENAGLKVKVDGYGTVKKQSLTPGGPARKGAEISIELS